MAGCGGGLPNGVASWPLRCKQNNMQNVKKLNEQREARGENLSSSGSGKIREFLVDFLHV